MSLKLSDKHLRLREIRDEDLDLLCRIYSSTRQAEMDRVQGWTEDQKRAFLHFQFEAQHRYYMQQYAGSRFWILEHEGEPIGRLYLDEVFDGKSARIIDISLLPQWRSRGIGGRIVQDVIAQAEETGRGVTIHVESFNPAMRLYQRLGFRMVDVTNGVYHLLERPCRHLQTN